MIYTSRKQWNKPRGKYLVYASKCLIPHGKHQLLSLTFYKICRCPQIGGRQENIHEEDMIKLLLVDDQTIVRQGLRRRLLLEPDISVVGEASSGEQALELVQALDPDIVLMDVEMPGMDGITATATMHDHASQCTVVMLSIHDDIHTRTQALAAGAAAFVEKRGAVEVLLATIRQATVPGRT